MTEHTAKSVQANDTKADAGFFTRPAPAPGPGPAADTGGIVQRKPTTGSPPPNTGADIAGKGAGRPLPSGTRSFFEGRLGTDLGGVRIHTDQRAARMAKGLNAKAFTHGQDVFFSAKRFAPERAEGQRLLAHELTHTIQQRSETPRIQRQGEDEETAVTGYFSINVRQEMNAEQALLEFVKQYRGVDADEARQLIETEGWTWSGAPVVFTAEDVARTYRVVTVRDRFIQPLSDEDRETLRQQYGNLSAGQRRSINSETYRRFRERSQIRGPLDANSDARLRGYWHRIREEILHERTAVRNLPPEIRAFLFAQSSTNARRISPSDYPAILRIAEKLAGMSAADRDRYLSSTTGRTTNLALFESSLDRFLTLLNNQREATMEREQAKAALLGLEQVYDKYLIWKAFRDSARDTSMFGSHFSGAGEGSMRPPGFNPQMNALGSALVAASEREELTELLAEHGYDSIGEFERAIRRFENAFKAEALLIAKDMLARYAHVLWTQEERYRSRGTVRRLHGQLAPARRHFREADRITEDHAIIPGPFSPGEDLAQMQHYVGLRQEQLHLGHSSVQGLADENPLFRDNDFPSQDIAGASAGSLQRDLLDYITEHRRDMENTRTNLEHHPDLIWELTPVIQRTRATQNIQPGSIYDRILTDAQRGRGLTETMINLAVAVIAIAAGLVSMGGGTVGVLAAATAFGISGIQAYQEFQRYETRSAAHGAQLLSEDPSIAWVIVALIGAGIDAAGVAAALRAGSGALATAARSVTTMEEVDAVGVAATRAGLSSDEVSHVVAAARAEMDSNAAWTAARRAGGRLYAAIDPIVTPTIILATRFTYPMYMSLRQGVFGIQRFLMTRRIVNLIGDFRQMSPAALARVRDAYSLALTNAQRVAAHGHQLGLLDQEIERFLLQWNRFPNMTADDMIAQLDELAAPLAARANARSRIAPSMVLDDASRARLPDFDRQIAGTGGIEVIAARRGPDGGLVVTIEGEILPQRLTRSSGQVSATRRRAPSFNSRYPIRAADLGLSGDEWHRLHLWGPGFGDEAAAGMFWGPKEINLGWQNESIETYIRDLGELANRHGGRARVRARAVAWERPTPGGFDPPMGENFLKEVNYDITLVRPGEAPTTITVNLQLVEPPGTGVHSFSIDPPGAADLGDLF